MSCFGQESSGRPGQDRDFPAKKTARLRRWNRLDPGQFSFVRSEYLTVDHVRACRGDDAERLTRALPLLESCRHDLETRGAHNGKICGQPDAASSGHARPYPRKAARARADSHAVEIPEPEFCFRHQIGHERHKVTGCWANLNAPGAGHPAHIHPNNYLSGVYYVQTQPGADTINFFDPRSQTGIIRPPVTALTAENTEQVVVKIERGTLLMFPAWLQHSVDLNGSDRVRISLGFNIMFPGYAEAMARPSWVPGRRPAV